MRLAEWNDLDRLAGLDLQCCFVAVGAVSTRPPLSAEGSRVTRARLIRDPPLSNRPWRSAAHPLTALAYRKTRPMGFALNPRQTNTLGDQIQATWSTLVQRPATPSRSG
jgi:hypothetical protein